MIQQSSQPITFEAFFTAAKQGKTGLTVTVDAYAPDGTALVTAGAATETGGGFYRYTLSGGSTYDPGAYRAIFKTSDTSVDLQHVPSLWEVGVAGVDNLDAAVSSRTASALGVSISIGTSTSTKLYLNYPSTGYAYVLVASGAMKGEYRQITSRGSDYDPGEDINYWYCNVSPALPSVPAYNTQLYLCSGSYIASALIAATETDLRLPELSNLDATVSSRLATTGYTAPTAPPSTSDISTAVWGAATRSLTDKSGFSLTTAFPSVLTISDVQTALTNQGVTIARANSLDNLDTTISSRLATTGYTAPTSAPSASDISTAVWGAATRSLTDKAGYSLATPFPTVLTVSDVQTALTNQGLTTTRAAYLDAAISSRLSAADYNPAEGGGSGGASVRLVRGPLALYSDSAGSDGVVEIATGDAVTLALYLRDGNNEPIPYTTGTLTAKLTDTFGNVVIASIATEEISTDLGIAQVSLTLSQRGRFRLTVKRDGGAGDIATFGPLQIHVCGAGVTV